MSIFFSDFYHFYRGFLVFFTAGIRDGFSGNFEHLNHDSGDFVGCFCRIILTSYLTSLSNTYVLPVASGSLDFGLITTYNPYLSIETREKCLKSGHYNLKTHFCRPR